MPRHPSDGRRRAQSARLARFLEIERQGRVHGPHLAVTTLHRRGGAQGGGRPPHYARIERGRAA